MRHNKTGTGGERLALPCDDHWFDDQEVWPYSEAHLVYIPPLEGEALLPAIRPRATAPAVRIVVEAEPDSSEPFSRDGEQVNRTLLRPICITALLLLGALGVVKSLTLASGVDPARMRYLVERPETARRRIIHSYQTQPLAGLLKTKGADSSLLLQGMDEAKQRSEPEVTAALCLRTLDTAGAVRLAALRALNTPFHLSQPQTLKTLDLLVRTDSDLMVRAYAAKLLASRPEGIGMLQRHLRTEKNSFVAAIIVKSLEQHLGAGRRPTSAK
ncbi:MAG: hypothetical protein KDD69_04795 [Bdellovibrionales bacterium]|nr:hypothetical protein [Bdellovibrionales bacterium]